MVNIWILHIDTAATTYTLLDSRLLYYLAESFDLL